jgi:hypothetical protein
MRAPEGSDLTQPTRLWAIDTRTFRTYPDDLEGLKLAVHIAGAMGRRFILWMIAPNHVKGFWMLTAPAQLIDAIREARAFAVEMRLTSGVEVIVQADSPPLVRQQERLWTA